MWFFGLGARGEGTTSPPLGVTVGGREGEGKEWEGRGFESRRRRSFGDSFHQQCYVQVLLDVRPGYVFYRKLRGISSRVNNPPPFQQASFSNPLSRPSHDAP